MKKIAVTILALVISVCGYGQESLLSQSVLNAPCNMCLELLKDGLEEELNIRKGEHFNQDLKTFFTSDKFLEEYKNGKWQGAIGLIVDGFPIDFGIGSSDEELRRMQERIRTATSLETTSQFYETYRKVTKNNGLAQIYLDCLVKVCRESDDIGFVALASNTRNSATFILTYRDRGGRPATVRNFEIKSNGKIIRATNAYKKGDKLLPEKKITAVRNPKEDLVMTISTTAGDEILTIESEESAAMYYNQLPIGTVIASYLDFDQFNAVTNNNDRNPYKLWSDIYSFWAPCDGRNVENSLFARIANLHKESVPDLRGVFLRGLNSFDKNEKTSVSVEQADPKINRVVGELQVDAIQNHKHADKGHTHGSNAITASTILSDNADDRHVGSPVNSATIHVGHADIGGPVKIDESSSEVRKDIETRPKNVAIYYYIKIN